MTPRSYSEMDYLRGMRDDLRQGALRFGNPDAGAYLAREDTGVPHPLQLQEFLGPDHRGRACFMDDPGWLVARTTMQEMSRTASRTYIITFTNTVRGTVTVAKLSRTPPGECRP